MHIHTFINNFRCFRLTQLFSCFTRLIEIFSKWTMLWTSCPCDRQPSNQLTAWWTHTYIHECIHMYNQLCTKDSSLFWSINRLFTSEMFWLVFLESGCDLYFKTWQNTTNSHFQLMLWQGYWNGSVWVLLVVRLMRSLISNFSLSFIKQIIVHPCILVLPKLQRFVWNSAHTSVT